MRLGALAATVIDPDERNRINDARIRLTATDRSMLQANTIAGHDTEP